MNVWLAQRVGLDARHLAAVDLHETRGEVVGLRPHVLPEACERGEREGHGGRVGLCRVDEEDAPHAAVLAAVQYAASERCSEARAAQVQDGERSPLAARQQTPHDGERGGQHAIEACWPQELGHWPEACAHPVPEDDT